VIGSWNFFGEDSKGLYMEGGINLRTELGKYVFTLIEDNDLKGLSIGYSIWKSYEDDQGKHRLQKGRLWETSIVAIPMNQEAWIMGTKIFTGADFKKSESLVTKFEDNADWEEVARTMVSLLSNRFTYKDLDLVQKKSEYDYISGWYKKFDKKPPEVDFEKGFEFKDIEFSEDEKYLAEIKEFKNNIIKITDILKHWQKAGRELPEDDLSELCELLAKENHSVSKKLEAVQLKKVQSINKLSVKVENLINTIEAEDIRKAKILDQVDLIVKEALYKATGKRI
jgi:hypothetical protein